MPCATGPVPGPASPAVDTAPPVPGAHPAPSLAARRQQLRDLVAEQWEYTMRTNPEWASTLGDKRYNDRWSDRSEKAIHDDLAHSQHVVDGLEATDTTGFPEQERLNKVLLSRQLKLVLEGARFEDWLMPVNQFWGMHLGPAELVTTLPFTSVKDYEDYVTRLRTLPGHPQPGARPQGRPAEDPRAAREGQAGARRAVRHPWVPRRRPGYRGAAARRAGRSGRRVDREGQGDAVTVGTRRLRKTQKAPTSERVLPVGASFTRLCAK